MKIVRKVEKVVEEEILCANDCSFWYAVVTSGGTLLALHYSRHAAKDSVEDYENRYDMSCRVEEVYTRQITL